MGYSRGISYPLVGSIPCRPPRVRTITFISQPPHLLYGVRVALDFFLSCRVVRPKSALYEVSVRRPETLPVLALLSLHIRLPSDPTSRWAPLPSASGSCYRVRSGLSPPSYRPCRAHSAKKRAERLSFYLISCSRSANSSPEVTIQDPRSQALPTGPRLTGESQ